MGHHQPRPATEYRRPGYGALLLCLTYLLLALVLTWPTVTHLGTHLPGDGGDDPAIAWNLWWVKFALLNRGQNPFYTDFMFYPVGINLAFYTLTVLNAVAALPLTLNLGVVAASNLHLFLTFVVGGYGAFLLTRSVLTAAIPESDRMQIWVSAALAGGFYAFAGSKLFYVALGQFNIAGSHWLPWTVLYLTRTRRTPRRLKNAVMAGLFLTLQAWTEMTYASFLLVFLGLYWLYWLGIASTRPNRWPALQPHLQAAVVMGLTFALGLSPILAQMLPDMAAEGDFLVEGSGFAGDYSADLLGFFIPTMHHPWLGNLIRQTNIGTPGSATGFDKGQHIYPGFVLLGLLLVSLATGFRRPTIRFWLLATLIFALLCLGPVISVNGYATGLPGPFVLLQSLPFFKGNRYPSRYSVMLLLALSVLAGFSLVQIQHWARQKFTKYKLQIVNRKSQIVNHYSPFTIHLVPALIFLIFLVEHLSLPLPQSDLRVPEPYQRLAAEPGDFTVLDIPFAWRNGFRITGAFTTQFMFGQFYQTFHQKRLLQGNTSRNPEFKFQYFTGAPVINSLLALETGQPLPPEQWEADRPLAAEVLRFFNIRYIVVRPEPFNPFGHYPQATVPYLEAVLPVEKIHDEADLQIYRVQDSPPPEPGLQSSLQIEPRSPLASLYFGEGWGLLSPERPIAAQRRQVRLLLPLSGAAQRLSLQIRLPGDDSSPAQSVAVEVNGWRSPAQPVTAAWQELTFDLPAGVARPGLDDVWLHFAEVMRLPQTPRLDVTVRSAGQEVGNFGHIYLNGREVSPNRRGYNVALIQPDGRLAAANFDTFLDPAASTALADFLSAAPDDALIAIAAADEASYNLSEEAVRALQAIGAKGDLRGCFRCSHALIVDPAAGATLEALDPRRPLGLTTNLGLTEPTVAAVIDWIKVEADE
ncbi:MAG: interleukin-like EMT inducer domain-containing protein [Chloroflexota bacterium]